jgi:hypothetical protein
MGGGDGRFTGFLERLRGRDNEERERERQDRELTRLHHERELLQLTEDV